MIRTITTLAISLVVLATSAYGQRMVPRGHNPAKDALKKSQIKELNFEDAKIPEVLDFLIDQSRELDPDGIGMNLIYLPEQKQKQVSAKPPRIDPALADIFGIEATGALQEAPAFDPETTITLRLRRVSMYDALGYITEMAGLRFTIEKNVVIVRPAGQGGNIETRFYAIDPALMAKQMQARQQAQRLNENNPFDF